MQSGLCTALSNDCSHQLKNVELGLVLLARLLHCHGALAAVAQNLAPHGTLGSPVTAQADLLADSDNFLASISKTDFLPPAYNLTRTRLNAGACPARSYQETNGQCARFIGASNEEREERHVA